MPDLIIPPRKKPSSDSGFFEILTKAVFQAGFSWKVVEAKWGGFKEEFMNFDPKIISRWNEEQIVKLLDSPLIIRNENKIRATIENARNFNKLVDKYQTFGNYIDSIQKKPYEERSKILSKQFKWLGKTGAFFFLYSIGEEVPKWEDR